MRNRVTRNIGMNKHREMNKKTYVFTVDVYCLISFKYFTLYAVSVNGALTLLISSLLKAVAAQICGCNATGVGPIPTWRIEL